MTGEGKYTSEFRKHAIITVIQWMLSGVLLWMQVGSIGNWPETISSRVSTAVTKLPTAPSERAACVLVLSMVALAAYGLGSGYMSYKPRWDAALFFSSTIIDFLEEVWFRGCLVDPNSRDPLQLGLSWLIFWLYHMDLIHLYTVPDGGRVFSNPKFLVIAAFLGVGCIAAYVGFGGSIWASVAFHIGGLWIWMFLLGGLDTLGINRPTVRAKELDANYVAVEH